MKSWKLVVMVVACIHCLKTNDLSGRYYEIPNSFIVLELLIFNFNANANDTKLTESIGIGISDKSGSTVALKFIPPDDEGWSAKSSGLSVTLKNSTDSEDDNREIEAYLMRVEAPISPRSDYIKTIRRNTLEGYANSNKFKINELEITEDSKDAMAFPQTCRHCS